VPLPTDQSDSFLSGVNLDRPVNFQSVIDYKNFYCVAITEEGDVWHWVHDKPYSSKNWAENEPMFWHSDIIVANDTINYDSSKISSNPSKILDLHNIVSVSLSRDGDAYAVKNDGTVWKWKYCTVEYFENLLPEDNNIIVNFGCVTSISPSLPQQIEGINGVQYAFYFHRHYSKHYRFREQSGNLSSYLSGAMWSDESSWISESDSLNFAGMCFVYWDRIVLSNLSLYDNSINGLQEIYSLQAPNGKKIIDVDGNYVLMDDGTVYIFCYSWKDDSLRFVTTDYKSIKFVQSGHFYLTDGTIINGSTIFDNKKGIRFLSFINHIN